MRRPLRMRGSSWSVRRRPSAGAKKGLARLPLRRRVDTSPLQPEAPERHRVLQAEHIRHQDDPFLRLDPRRERLRLRLSCRTGRPRLLWWAERKRRALRRGATGWLRVKRPVRSNRLLPFLCLRRTGQRGLPPSRQPRVRRRRVEVCGGPAGAGAGPPAAHRLLAAAPADRGGRIAAGHLRHSAWGVEVRCILRIAYDRGRCQRNDGNRGSTDSSDLTSTFDVHPDLSRWTFDELRLSQAAIT